MMADRYKGTLMEWLDIFESDTMRYEIEARAFNELNQNDYHRFMEFSSGARIERMMAELRKEAERGKGR